MTPRETTAAFAFVGSNPSPSPAGDATSESPSSDEPPGESTEAVPEYAAAPAGPPATLIHPAAGAADAPTAGAAPTAGPAAWRGADGRTAALPGHGPLDRPAQRAGESPIIPLPGVRPEPQSTYGRPFWLAYVANCLMTTAVSLLFRYADLVSYLGGSEYQLGWIVGTGMIGAVVVRVLQGVGIDRYGPRQIWLWSSCGFVASCLSHLGVQHVDGPLIYVLRVVYTTSIAGFYGASITFIAQRASMIRIAEVVGTLGTSGFLGMVLGTSLGDLLFNGGPLSRGQLDQMFLVAAGLGVVSAGFSWLATWGVPRPPRRRQLPVGFVLRRYHPGSLLLICVAVGLGLGFPGAFVRPFATSLGLAGIAPFFVVYMPTAFVTRLAARRLPERIGIRPMIYLGMAAMTLSMLLFMVVGNQWQLAIPAVFLGIAHALLFPAVVAGGSAGFPPRYRGLGTTLVLATNDLGNLVGGPLVGGMLHYAGWLGWPRYPSMFVAMSFILAAITGYYALAAERQSRRSSTRRRWRKRPDALAEENPVRLRA